MLQTTDRPLISYAAAVWSLISRNQMNRLGLFERKCLRYCVNSRRQIGPAGVPLFESEAVKFFDKLSNNDNQLIQNTIELRESLLEGDWKPPWYVIYIQRNNQHHPSGGLFE